MSDTRFESRRFVPHTDGDKEAKAIYRAVLAKDPKMVERYIGGFTSLYVAAGGGTKRFIINEVDACFIGRALVKPSVTVVGAGVCNINFGINRKLSTKEYSSVTQSWGDYFNCSAMYAVPVVSQFELYGPFNELSLDVNKSGGTDWQFVVSVDLDGWLCYGDRDFFKTLTPTDFPVYPYRQPQ